MGQKQTGGVVQLVLGIIGPVIGQRRTT